MPKGTAGRIEDNLPQACNTAKEENYLSPLLVNIKVI